MVPPILMSAHTIQHPSGRYVVRAASAVALILSPPQFRLTVKAAKDNGTADFELAPLTNKIQVAWA